MFTITYTPKYHSSTLRVQYDMREKYGKVDSNTFTGIDGEFLAVGFLSSSWWRRMPLISSHKKSRWAQPCCRCTRDCLDAGVREPKESRGEKDSLKLNILHAVCRMCREVVCWLIFIGYASLGVFIPTWGNDPISLEFFKWVETTN